MEIFETKLDGVLIIKPKRFEDDRGFFFESYNKKKFDEAIGRKVSFLQDNFSCSHQGVFRGIHYQKKPFEQAKLVSAYFGSVTDYVVDLRENSLTYLQWEKFELSDKNGFQVWIPEGFGHAFLATSKLVYFSYKTSEFYNQNSEECIRWDDPKIGLKLDKGYDFKISEKDKNGKFL